MWEAISREKVVSQGIFQQELVAVARRYWVLLLAGPILVGAITYFVTRLQPGEFVSVAFLQLERPADRVASALISSGTLVEKAALLAKSASPRPTVRALLIDTDPLIGAPHLFRLEVAAAEPAAAQALANGLIDAWLEATRPGENDRAVIERQVQALRQAAAADDGLLKRLQAEATTLVLPNSMGGELATPLSRLMERRDAGLSRATDLERKMSGLTRDVVVEGPSLPRDAVIPSAPGRAILAAIVTLPLLLAFVLVMRFIGPLRRTGQ
jgi:hypothetical protein